MDEILAQLLAYVDVIGRWLVADQTHFWMSWVGLALLFGMASYLAWRVVRSVRTLRPESLVIAPKPGRKPTRASSIQKRIDEANAYASSLMAALTRQVTLLLVLGMVVPGAVLGTIAVKQEWFLPGQPALQVADGPFEPGDLGYVEVAIFFADQAMRGALSDTFEVFDVSLSGVTNNADNFVFSLLVLAYRFLCGFVAATLLYVVFTVFQSRPHLNAHIDRLRNDLQIAQASAS